MRNAALTVAINSNNKVVRLVAGVCNRLVALVVAGSKRNRVAKQVDLLVATLADKLVARLADSRVVKLVDTMVASLVDTMVGKPVARPVATRADSRVVRLVDTMVATLADSPVVKPVARPVATRADSQAVRLVDTTVVKPVARLVDSQAATLVFRPAATLVVHAAGAAHRKRLNSHTTKTSNDAALLRVASFYFVARPSLSLCNNSLVCDMSGHGPHLREVY